MNQVILDMLVEEFGLQPEQLTPDATLASLGLDSLAVVEFMFQIEERFKISLPEVSTPPASLGELMAYLEPALPADLTAAGKPSAA